MGTIRVLEVSEGVLPLNSEVARYFSSEPDIPGCILVCEELRDRDGDIEALQPLALSPPDINQAKSLAGNFCKQLRPGRFQVHDLNAHLGLDELHWVRNPKIPGAKRPLFLRVGVQIHMAVRGSDNGLYYYYLVFCPKGERADHCLVKAESEIVPARRR